MAALSVIAGRLPAHSCDASFASSARSSLCTSGSRSVVVVVGGRWPHSSSKRSVVLGGGKSAAAEATAATARRLRVSCGSAVDTHADWGGRGYSTELPPMGVLRRRRRGVRCTAEASTGGGGVEGVVGSVGDAKGESEREGSAELAGEMEGAGDKIAAYLNEVLKVWEPPKFMWRTLYTLLLLGLVVKRVIWQRKLNMQQTLQQIARVGPETLGVSMLTSAFVGMVFTIQFCQEFSKVGLTRVIGGLLGLAFSRELTPVICAIVMAGRVGSAIAAELGTMQVSEQVDQLRTLGSDPVDYLVAPRVVACALSLPILSVISFTIGGGEAWFCVGCRKQRGGESESILQTPPRHDFTSTTRKTTCSTPLPPSLPAPPSIERSSPHHATPLETSSNLK